MTRPRLPVLVIGATGRVGRGVIAELLAASVPVRALTRRPGTAALPAGVEVMAGDLTVPESLDRALQGISAVFVVWTAPPMSAPAIVERLARHAPRVVLLSSPHQTPHPFFQQPNPLAALHAGIERLIAESGVPSTTIRPGMFASNARLWWSEAIRTGEVVRWPYGGAQTAPIHDGDIAAVAARALCEDTHTGNDYVITGPESLSQADQVRIIGEASGRKVRFHELSPEEFRQETASRWPAAAANMLLAAWGATIGRPAFMTSTVADVTGSPARTFSQWAVDHADAFRGGGSSETGFPSE